MPDAPSTLDAGTSIAAAASRRDDLPALLIAWAPAEPHRIGEVALFEPDGGARVLGRGESAGGAERTAFLRQRPGRTDRTGPLASPGLSREQLRVRVENGSLKVQ